MAEVIKEFKDSEVIFREGDIGKEMYIIKSGRVAISKKMQGIMTKLAVLEAGDFFGEIAVFDNKPRSATAMAVDQTVLAQIDSETFQTMIREDPGFALTFLKTIMERLRKVDQELTRLTTQGLLPKDQVLVLKRYTWASTYD